MSYLTGIAILIAVVLVASITSGVAVYHFRRRLSQVNDTVIKLSTATQQRVGDARDEGDEQKRHSTTASRSGSTHTMHPQTERRLSTVSITAHASRTWLPLTSPNMKLMDQRRPDDNRHFPDGAHWYIPNGNM